MQGVAFSAPESGDPKEGMDGASPAALSPVVPIWLPPERGQQQTHVPDADVADDSNDGSAAAVGEMGEIFFGGPSLPPAIPAQMPQWKVAWSEEHHRNYYHNATTGVSQWTRPLGEEIMAHTSQSWSSMDGGIGRGIDLISEQLRSRVWGIWRWPSIRHGWRWRFLEDSCGVVVSALLLMYPVALRQTMAFLRCDRVGDVNDSRLLMAPDIICGSTPHIPLAIAALAFLVLWGLGVPACTYYLYVTRGDLLGDFNVHVRWGVLFAEYEHGLQYMEVARLLQIFGVVASATLLPSAPHELRLVLLLAMGNVAAFMHQSIEPLTNLSGYLLDSAVTQSLMVFCALTTALLLGLSRVVHPILCSMVLMFALFAHFLFLLRIMHHFALHLRRSIADSVVALHMSGKEAMPWRLKVFAWEMTAKQRQANVFYNVDSNEIVVAPPVANTRNHVHDEEQRLVASALGDCLAHAVASSKVDRLSCYFLEYLGRTSFAMSAEKLDREMQVHLQVRPSVRVALSERACGNSHSGPELPSPKKRRVSECGFEARTFRQGMLAGDFGGALKSVCLSCETELMEQEFHHFMVLKHVVFGDYQLTPLQRMLKNFEHGKTRPPWAGGKLKEAGCTTLVVRPLQKMFPPPEVYEVAHDDDAAFPKTSDTVASVSRNGVLKRGEGSIKAESQLASASVRAAALRRSKLQAQTEHGSRSEQDLQLSPGTDNFVELPREPRRWTVAKPESGVADEAHTGPRQCATADKPGLDSDIIHSGDGDCIAVIGVSNVDDTGAGVGVVDDDIAVGVGVVGEAVVADAPVVVDDVRGSSVESAATVAEGITASLGHSPGDGNAAAIADPIVCNGLAIVAPWGVLGLQRSRRVAAEPHHDNIVIADATTQEIIAGGPRISTGSSADICTWLGIQSDETYPTEVRHALEDELGAKFHRYPGGRDVIHVATPNLGELKYQVDSAEVIEALTIAYRRVFQEFCANAGVEAQGLRVPAFSLGERAGDHEHEMPDLTAEAFGRAISELDSAARDRICKLVVLEICVNDEELFHGFAASFETRGVGVARPSLSQARGI